MARFLLLLFLLISSASAQQPYQDLLRHWDYDQNAPLAMKEEGVEVRGGVKIHDISFATSTGDRGASLGPNAGRVTAYLVTPAGRGPFPAVIYGHWCMPGSAQMNRTEFLNEAVVLARAGVVSLLPDHVIVSPGFVADKTPLNTQQIDVVVQQVVNMRRSIDVLLTRKEVDPKRVAFVGHSCNGEVAGFLSGLERRVKAVVVMAGPLSDEVSLKSKAYQDFRQQIGPERFDAFVAKYSWTDPGLYVSHSEGIPKLLQFATDEPVLDPERAKQYLPYVSDPKSLKIYEAPHALNSDATRDRIAFLVEQLGFTAPESNWVASIPPLTQPPWPKPQEIKKDDKAAGEKKR